MESIADLRAECAQLPYSQETFPFNDHTLVFKVAGHMYALTDLSSPDLRLSVKVNPERGEALRATYLAIQPGYHLNKRHWITLHLDGSVPDALVRDLLHGSHALVMAGLNSCQRQELGL